MSTFRTTRQLAAEPAAVFAAIKDPARLATWWGPDGFSNRFDVFEFRPGGKWVFSMIGPDGKVYPNESVFTEIEADRRVVIRHISQPHFRLTITLEPSSGGTLLRWEQAFDDASVARSIAHIVEPANEQNLDRLSTELGSGNASAA
ncbi:SRPBCC domain-containing protein [Noviherbaspirillum sp. UKPF54]|uniref:SRPBCC domain-containing protein n=1 Tax=Noviherbaspirillum sp. UKPF54 TaxID=2601898 RepID=UPI0011B10EB3|nr:SRPBCC domain-containing protein [Noviherbaspirillum sp. UKPF54]QDZ26764.1 polyketide cyclase [Noviherbaspirillum sp. UKPF54]